jgi:isopenicillin-N epimerase
MTAATTFGRHLLSEWMLDPALSCLNHGTVGATPRRVIEKYRPIQDDIELLVAALSRSA